MYTSCLSYPNFLLANRRLHEYFAARQSRLTCPKLSFPGVNFFIKCGLWFTGAPDYGEGHLNVLTDENYTPDECKSMGINASIKKSIDRTHHYVTKTGQFKRPLVSTTNQVPDPEGEEYWYRTVAPIIAGILEGLKSLESCDIDTHFKAVMFPTTTVFHEQTQKKNSP